MLLVFSVHEVFMMVLFLLFCCLGIVVTMLCGCLCLVFGVDIFVL